MLTILINVQHTVTVQEQGLRTDVCLQKSDKLLLITLVKDRIMSKVKCESHSTVQNLLEANVKHLLRLEHPIMIRVALVAAGSHTTQMTPNALSQLNTKS